MFAHQPLHIRSSSSYWITTISSASVRYFSLRCTTICFISSANISVDVCHSQSPQMADIFFLQIFQIHIWNHSEKKQIKSEFHRNFIYSYSIYAEWSECACVHARSCQWNSVVTKRLINWIAQRRQQTVPVIHRSWLNKCKCSKQLKTKKTAEPRGDECAGELASERASEQACTITLFGLRFIINSSAAFLVLA